MVHHILLLSTLFLCGCTCTPNPGIAAPAPVEQPPAVRIIQDNKKEIDAILKAVERDTRIAQAVDTAIKKGYNDAAFARSVKAVALKRQPDDSQSADRDRMLLLLLLIIVPIGFAVYSVVTISKGGK